MLRKFDVFSRPWRISAFLLVIIIAGFFVTINIDKPFIGQHDWNGVVYGQQAKNFYRYGFIPLKFGTTMSTPDVPAENRVFQIHYSPMLPMLISFSYRVFGVSEWSTRLVPVVASLASLVLVMLLGRELISFRGGIMAGVLMAVTPMFIYYGKNPVHEIVLLPFALLAFYSYRRFLKTGKEDWWKILLLTSIAAMLIGWSGYYATGLIFLHGILYQSKGKMRFLQLPLITIASLSIFFFHAIILNPQASSELQNIFLARLGGTSIGLIDFLTKELRYSINLFTSSLLFLSAIGFFCCFRSRSILFFLGLFGLAHVLIFRQAGYYHEYLLFQLLPFIALTSAGAVENLLKLFQGLKIKIFIIGLILALTANERLGYLQALLKSEYVRDVYQEAVEYGKIVKANPDVIVPMERDVYFVFYADTVRKK